MDIIVNNSNAYNTEIKSYNDYIYKKSIVTGIFWDEEIIDEILNNIQENTDILDIGSNIGLVTLGVIKKAKESKQNINAIHCFECDPKLIPLLISNVSPFEMVKVYPFALSDKEEICHITTLDSNMGCNYIYKSNNSSNTIEYDYSKLFFTPAHKRNNNVCLLGTSLDNIGYQFTNKISVIKIDVEGYELNVLRGALELIKKHRPVVITEVFEKINFDDLVNIFEKLNYSHYKKICNIRYTNEDYIFYP